MINNFKKTKTEISKLAHNLLTKAKNDKIYEFQKHTNVELIAEKTLNLNIIITNLKKEFQEQNILAGMDFENNIIWIDENHYDNSIKNKNEGRLNFSIAHEIGHFILHKELFEKSKGNLTFFQNHHIHSKSIEWQANYFASVLLLPNTAVQSYVYDIKKIKQNKQKRDIIKETSRHFKTSKQMAEYRLKELNLIE